MRPNIYQNTVFQQQNSANFSIDSVQSGSKISKAIYSPVPIVAVWLARPLHVSKVGQSKEKGKTKQSDT